MGLHRIRLPWLHPQQQRLELVAAARQSPTEEMARARGGVKIAAAPGASRRSLLDRRQAARSGRAGDASRRDRRSQGERRSAVLDLGDSRRSDEAHRAFSPFAPIRAVSRSSGKASPRTAKFQPEISACAVNEKFLREGEPPSRKMTALRGRWRCFGESRGASGKGSTLPGRSLAFLEGAPPSRKN